MSKKSEQMSAMLDGELLEDELGPLLTSLDDADREAWAMHGLVGDLIRSAELSHFHDARLVRGIESALAKEAVVVAPQLKIPRNRGMQRAMLFAVASVCFMALFVHHFVPYSGAMLEVVALEEERKVGAADVAQWEEYLMAHQQYSVHRAIPSLSSVARVEPDSLTQVGHAALLSTVDNNSTAWINVWGDAVQNLDSQHARLNYVSEHR